jgi:hypothetical protein
MLAEDLRDTGQILIPLGEDEKDEKSATSNAKRVPAFSSSAVPMAQLVAEAWDEVKGQFPEGVVNFEVSGDCTVYAVRGDLFIAVSRLLQWLAQRSMDTNPDIRPLIRVVCEDTEKGPQLTFQDRSRRLSEPLRQRLFFPFAQSGSSSSPEKGLKGPGLYLPLYLAKMLVEVKHSGTLNDRSDDLEGNVGHKFVMSFPQSAPTIAISAGSA